MAKDAVEVQIRLPLALADEIKAIAKLAGLPVDAVIKLSVALEVRKWRHDRPKPMRDATLAA